MAFTNASENRVKAKENRKEYYEKRMKGATVIVGDTVLVLTIALLNVFILSLTVIGVSTSLL